MPRLGPTDCYFRDVEPLSGLHRALYTVESGTSTLTTSMRSRAEVRRDASGGSTFHGACVVAALALYTWMLPELEMRRLDPVTSTRGGPPSTWLLVTSTSYVEFPLARIAPGLRRRCSACIRATLRRFDGCRTVGREPNLAIAPVAVTSPPPGPVL